MNEVYVLDQSFNLLGVIDEYVSIIWRPAYYEIGDFEIYLGASDKAFNLLQKNRYVVRKSDISVDKDGNVTYKKVMVIKNILVITDVENGDFITVTGRELKFILHQRIIWNQTNLSGTAEKAIKRLVTENAVSPTNPNRVIPNLVLGASANILPDEYVQVEYIESTGTEYINTELYAPDGFTAEIDVNFTSIGSESCVIGAWQGNMRRYFGKIGSWYVGAPGLYKTPNINTNENLKIEVCTTNNEYLKVNGENQTLSVVAADKEYEIANLPVFLLSVNVSRTPRSPAIAKLYYCKIWDVNGVLVRDFVPCYRKSDGVAGVYDLVDSTFYGNSGTGNFKVGAEINSIFTETIEKQITGDYLDETIVNICTTYNYGWDIYIYNNKLVFNVYKGLDRSYGQSERPYVVFSESFENLYNSEYQLNCESFANATLIGGEGEGVNRIFTTVGDNLTGLERYETFTDARDISRNQSVEDLEYLSNEEIDAIIAASEGESGSEGDTEGEEEEVTEVTIPLSLYYDLLKERGNENLATLTFTEAFTGEVLSNFMFKYGEDFNLGDLVTVISKYGIRRNVRVISAIESDDETGSKLVPQFNI